MSNSLGIVLCGLGRMGSIHIDNIVHNNKLKLLYIVEMDLQKAFSFVQRYQLENTECVHFSDAQKVMSNERVSGIVICTPTDTHESLVMLGLNAGKHVLCEKPLATNLKSIMACYKLAKEKSLRLLCAFNRRFDPQFHELFMRKSEVGALHSIKVCSRDSPKPTINYLKISGGIFHDCIVHDIDMLRWMTEEEPETIYSTAHCHDPEIEALNDYDSVFVVLKFPSGVLAHIDISRDCSHGYDQTVQLYGSKGNIKSENQRKSMLSFNGGKIQDDILFSFPERYAKAYAIELEHFIEAITDVQVQLRIQAKDTINATLLCQIAEDSCKKQMALNVKEYFREFLGSSGVDCNFPC